MKKYISLYKIFLLAVFIFVSEIEAGYADDEKFQIFPQLGHTAVVESASFSSNGKLVLSGDGVGSLILWSLQNAKELKRFIGHTGAITSVAISPDGNYVLSASKDKTMRLWDISSGNEIRRFVGHNYYVNSAVFSPDGKYILSGSDSISDMVRLWEAKSGKELHQFSGHIASIKAVNFSPDGTLAIAGGADKIIHLWNINSGEEVKKFAGHSASITSVNFSPDGKLVVSNSYDDTLRIWNTLTGEQIRSFDSKDNNQISSFSPDGKFVLFSGYSRKVHIRDITSGNEVAMLQGHSAKIGTAMFSPDSKYILTGSDDFTLKVWDFKSGLTVKTFQGYTSPVFSTIFSPDGKYALTGGIDKTLRLWDMLTGKQLRQFRGHTDIVNMAAFSPDGNYLASCSRDTTVRLWDVISGEELNNFKGHDKWVTSVSFSSDGKLLVSGSEDSTVRVWNISESKISEVFSDHSGPIYGVGFRPNENIVLSANIDRYKTMRDTLTLNIYNADSGDKIRSYVNLSEDYPSRVQFSKDGKFALSAHKSRNSSHQNIKYNLRLWDVSSGNGIISFTGHTGAVRTLDISSDSKFALSGGEDKTTRLWDMSDGRERASFTNKLALVTSVAFSPDVNKILSGDYNGVTHLIDIVESKGLASFIGFSDGEWITITPEGYYNSSLNGAKHLNIRQGLAVYGIDQFYDVFYRPDIVKAKLAGEDISPLITVTIDEAIKRPPPSVTFTSAPVPSSFTTAKVCYQAKSTGGGIGEVRLFQNGKLVKSDGFYRESVARTDSSVPVQLASLNGRSLQNDMRRIAATSSIQAGFIQTKPKGDSFKECVDIEAAPGENELAVYAFNGTNTVQSMPATATFTSSRPATEPHLYILSIGIDRFNDKNANLKYAAKDARDMAASIPQKAQGIFKPANIHTMQIADTQATKTEIKKQIDDIAQKIKPWDSFILFIASHGVMLGNQYYVVTSQYNGNLNDTTKLISSNEIVEMSKSIKSLSQLYIFDTCHAGGVDTIVSGLYDARMSVMAKKMGLHIYASAGSLQTAIDGYQGNGLFTYNLLSGIRSGKDADSNKDGKVSVVELGQYAKQKTTDVSTKIGHPQTPNIISFGKDAPILGVR